jgi:hypothetical protein
VYAALTEENILSVIADPTKNGRHEQSDLPFHLASQPSPLTFTIMQ